MTWTALLPRPTIKKLAGQESRMTYIELNGEGSIDSIRETLLSRLN